MTIIFKEDRVLIGGVQVEGGKTYDTFAAGEEQAFVDNGVADFVQPAGTQKGKVQPAGEVTSDGN